MKTRWLIVVILLISPCLSGCYWFVPGAVKRQSNLVNLDVKTCLKEIDEINKDPNKTKTNKLKESHEKAMRTLNRLKPQVQNLDDYTHGRQATRSVE